MIENKKRKESPFVYFKDIYGEMGFSDKISYSELKDEWKKCLETKQNHRIDLYIHIPLCRSKCKYCQYFSYHLDNNSIRKKYLDYLEKNFSFYRGVLEKINYGCAYVGGGTPTIFRDDEFRHFLKLFKENILFKEGLFERTFECRLEDLNKEKLRCIKDAGFNRISFGIQTFNKETLERENRTYVSPEKIKGLVRYCRENFDFVINADLIMGLGFDYEKEILENIKQILKTEVDTVSLYTIQDKIRGSMMFQNEGSGEKFYERLKLLYEPIEEIAINYGFKMDSRKEEVQVGWGLLNNSRLLDERIDYKKNLTGEGVSLFAIGWGASGRIENRLEYQISTKKHYSFDKEKNKCNYISDKKSKIKFLESSLKRGFVDRKIYLDSFCSDIESDFQNEIQLLVKKGILKKVDERYYWDTKDVKKKNFYFGIFYPIEDLIRLYNKNIICF